MRHFLLLIAALLLPASETFAEDSIFLGRVLSNTEIKDQAIECTPDGLCMDAWFHWQIKTQRVIKGPKLRGRIIAARTQHAGYSRQFTKELRLFAVRPITDANVRAKLKADFFLQDMSVAHEVFCLSSEIEVVVEDRHILLPKADEKTRCFDLPDAEQDG